MVLTTTPLDAVKQIALDVFDNYVFVSFGDSIVAVSQNDTALGNELLRTPVNIANVKDVGSGTFELEGRVPLSELNSATISEVGIHDAISSGNMGAHKLLPFTVTKTSDDEVIVKIKVTTNVING